MKLNAAEREAFERTKHVGYHYTKPEKVAVLAHYWQEANNRPLARICVTGKTAKIEMDLICMGTATWHRWQAETNRIALIGQLPMRAPQILRMLHAGSSTHRRG